jgi:protein-disulfide isomerase
MMKKFILLIVSAFLLLACTKTTETVDLNEMDNKLKAAVTATLQARGVTVDMAVERLAQLDNSDFYFYKITVTDTTSGFSQDQFLFFDGKFLTTEFVVAENNKLMSKEMIFENVNTSVDVSKLTLAYGKPDAKHVIVEITDFECPYCRNAYTYLEEKLKDRDDVAIYMAHLPLKIHENAEISARIFEAGMLMGHNFKAELFTGDMVLNGTPDTIATYFAEKSGDADKFMDMLFSDEVNMKLQSSLELVSELDMTSTPSFIINGKRIESFDQQLIDKALGF